MAQNRKHSEQLLTDIRPDLCLVVGWYWLFSKATIESVPGGILGIHNSLLPRYRGGAPLVWAMINGEREVGFSLFSIGDGMDDGDIWGQRTVKIGPEDAIADVLERIESEARSLLGHIFVPILEGKVKPTPQNHQNATFCSQRIPEDGEIHWNQPAEEVYNFIRAQSEPYPGAFTYLAGRKKMTVWRARPVELCYDGTPGQVVQIRGDGVLVSCGNRRPLLLTTVELENGAKVPAQTLLKSVKTTRFFPALRGFDDPLKKVG